MGPPRACPTNAGQARCGPVRNQAKDLSIEMRVLNLLRRTRLRRARAVLGLAALAGLVAALPARAGSMGAPTAASPTPFRFGPVNEAGLGLWEGSQAVLVYQHGLVRKAGVPERLARSSYVHPLHGPDGEVLTDDFPADHYHHRGLFWAWPHVTVAGAHYDLWMLRGIEQRFEQWLSRTVTASNAVLGVANGWYVNGRKVMAEQVWFRVAPLTTHGRVVDVELILTPTDQPVTLAGAEGKSYGGLTLRFAPGTNTVITVPAGSPPQDLAMTNLPWADLTRRWSDPGLTSGVAILVHPTHPDFPPQWLTRHYGVLCLGWPGVKPKTLQPGQPVPCRYRLWIHRGRPTVSQLQRAFELYRASPAAVATTAQ